MDEWQAGTFEDCTEYNMADGHDDVVSYEDAYSKSVIFFIGTDNCSSDPSPVDLTDSPDILQSEVVSCSHDDNTTLQSKSNHPNTNQEPTCDKEDKTEKKMESGNVNACVSPPGQVERTVVVTDAMENASKVNADNVVISETSETSRVPVLKDEQEEQRPPQPDKQSKKCLTDKEVMELYLERERQFTEDFLSKPIAAADPEQTGRPRPRTKTARRSRSVSPYPGIGLDHLGNLVRLLEQLSDLKEQNQGLRRKCTYLEHTKSLLYVHNVMLKSRGSMVSPKMRRRSKTSLKAGSRKLLQHQHMSDGGLLSCNHYDSDTSDDEVTSHEPTSSRTKLNKLSQRSQSVGSINVDNVDIDLTLGASHATSHKTADKHNKDGSRFEAMFSKSKISSKWERVKKVFSGKPEQCAKTEPATITAEQLVRANSKYTRAPQSPPPPPPPVSGYPQQSEVGERSAQRAPTSPGSPPAGAALEPSSSGLPEVEGPIPSVVANDRDVSDEGGKSATSEVVTDGDGQTAGGSSCESTSDSRPSPRRDTKTPTTAPVTDEEKSKSNFLSVKQSSLRRRQSSPTLCLSDESDVSNKEKGADSLEPPRSPSIRRSSSFKVTKSNDSFNDVSDDASGRIPTPKTPESRKSHKSAWGRVKDIIHTRKDSLKRKNKRSNSAGDMLPDANTMEEGFYEYCSKSDVEEFCYERYDGGDISPRSVSPRLTRKNSNKTQTTPSPHPSPPTKKRHESPPKTKRSEHIKSPPDSPPSTKTEGSSPLVRPSTSPGPLDVTALMGGMSEEFTKKIQEWEEKKRRSLFKDNSINLEDDVRESADAARFTEEFIRKMEEWEKMKGLGSPPKFRSGREGTTQSPDLCTPPDQASQSPSMEDLQKHLSESFSKTVQEWERIKTQRIKDTGSPVSDMSMRQAEKRSRKQERSKSRERDRSRSKYDKQRERELQKIEKKEQKIEKERQKLERMRQKLEGIETMSEVHVEGVSQEFARKLYEWEVMKGLRQEQPAPSAGDESVMASSTETSFTLHTTQTIHTRSQSAKAYKEFMNEKRERTQSESQVDGLGTGSGSETPIEGRCRTEGPNTRSASVPSVRSSTALVDDSTSIDLNLTTQDPPSDQTKTLLDDLAHKEDELAAMQHEVQQLTERISSMDIEHTKQIEHFKRELWASSQLGRYTIETDLVSASMYELRLKVDQLTAYQERLIKERDQLQTQTEREMTARQEVEARLISQLRRRSPPQGSQHQQAIESVQDFDKLCEFFLKLWSQLNELRLGVLERNKLLADMQHHVLRQEVANRLMAADMASRDLQLTYLQGARKRGILKRSHTFSGRDHITRGETKRSSSARRFLTCHHAMFEYGISQLRHGNTDATQVDWEWLERLRAQRASAIGRIQGAVSMATHAAQTELAPKGHVTLDSAAQTVMTLCNIPYATPPIPREVRLLTALSNKGVQADVPQESKSPPGTPIKIVPTATSTPIKPVPVTMEIIQPICNHTTVTSARPQLVRQKHTERPLSPTEGKSDNDTARPTSSSTLSSSSEQLKKEFMKRDFAAEMRQSLAHNTHQLFPEKNQRPTSTHSATFEREKLQPSAAESVSQGTPRQTGPWIRRFGALSDPEDSIGPSSSHPPHSPIIRSRNPRKLKAENKACSQQQCTDSRTWKATPPKRMLRHRRPSTEKRASLTSDTDTDGPSSPTLSSSDHVPPRRRLKEDRYSMPTTPRSLSVPPRDNVMYDLCFRERYTPKYTQRDIKPVVVHDMISKFESGSAASQAGGGCCRGNRSPSPAIRKPVVTPVRRLKTAAELMHDSESHRHGTWSSSQTRASSISPVPRSISSLSSDKENDKVDSRVHVIIHRLSRESTPDRAGGGAAAGGIPVSEAPTADMVKQVVRRLSESSIEGPKTALKDLTNGTKVKKMADTFKDRANTPDRTDPRQQQPPAKAPLGGKKHYELPKQGQVSRFASVYETKVESKEVKGGLIRVSLASSTQVSSGSVKTQEPKPVPGHTSTTQTVKSQTLGNTSTLPASGSSQGGQGDQPQQAKTLPSAFPAQQGATGGGGAVGSGGRDFKTKLFGRKTSKPSAVTMLCKQAVSVDMEDCPVPDEASKGNSLPRSPEAPRKDGSLEKSSRARRFLDTNWLQRPKRFFKVSK